MLHTSEKPFACELCPSRFKWKTALTTHMLVHTGQRQHVCDLCGSSFTTKGSMKKHKSKTESVVLMSRKTTTKEGIVHFRNSYG